MPMHTAYRMNTPEVRKINKAQYLTAETMIKWLEDNNVVELLLKSHEQIIKRSPKILKFLARHKCLSVAHVEALWKTTETKTKYKIDDESMQTLCSKK